MHKEIAIPLLLRGLLEYDSIDTLFVSSMRGVHILTERLLHEYLSFQVESYIVQSQAER